MRCTVPKLQLAQPAATACGLRSLFSTCHVQRTCVHFWYLSMLQHHRPHFGTAAVLFIGRPLLGESVGLPQSLNMNSAKLWNAACTGRSGW